MLGSISNKWKLALKKKKKKAYLQNRIEFHVNEKYF